MAEDVIEYAIPDKPRSRNQKYRLTDKGRDFYPVLAAMWRFGEDWLWPEGEEPPLQIVRRGTGEPIRPRVVDEETGEPIDVRKVWLQARS